MALIHLSVSTPSSTSKTLAVPSTSAAYASSSSSASSVAYLCRRNHCRYSLVPPPVLASRRVACINRRISRSGHVVCMAPEEEKLTRRNPLDFPIEWERPKPGRRPDIFPQFGPMKTPLPPPLPCDPPEEDEEEEEKKEEEEEDPEKEEPNKPEK